MGLLENRYAFFIVLWLTILQPSICQKFVNAVFYLGFGFVTFEADAAGKHVVETGFHKLKGKNVYYYFILLLIVWWRGEQHIIFLHQWFSLM